MINVKAMIHTTLISIIRFLLLMNNTEIYKELTRNRLNDTSINNVVC